MPISVSFSVDEVKDAIAKAERAIRRTREGLDRGLSAAGNFIKEESQKRVPVDTGVLRASHYVGDITGSTAHRQIVVGASANYAIFVHENKRGAVFNTGEAQFLWKAYNQNKQKVTNIIANAARQG